jgi:hypothetical protein
MFVSLYHDISIVLNFGNHVLFARNQLSFRRGHHFYAQPLSLAKTVHNTAHNNVPNLKRAFFNLPVMALIT